MLINPNLTKFLSKEYTREERYKQVCNYLLIQEKKSFGKHSKVCNKTLMECFEFLTVN